MSSSNQKVRSITYSIYPDSSLGQGGKTITMDLINTTVDQAIQIKNILILNPCIGYTTVNLTNGNVL